MGGASAGRVGSGEMAQEIEIKDIYVIKMLSHLGSAEAVRVSGRFPWQYLLSAAMDHFCYQKMEN